MNECPNCRSRERQVKNGHNPSGTQRYRCQCCGRVYTPTPKPHQYERSVRMQAVRLYVEGMNLRRIGRTLGVHHQSVANWVNAYSEQLPSEPTPASVETVELDEMVTFIGEKKTVPTS